VKPRSSGPQRATGARLLRTPRLLLRPFAPEHEDVLFEQWNDASVRKYLFDDEPVSRETVRAQIDASRANEGAIGCGYYLLALRDAPERPIGFAGLRPFGASGRVELLYALQPRYHRRGLATEAARAVLDHGFRRCGLAEIFAGADAPNEASFRVMTRLGMQPFADIVVGGRPTPYYRISRDAFAAARVRPRAAASRPRRR
jgi:[ribosomal protein S5]-alanine N-acetyltransferase